MIVIIDYKLGNLGSIKNMLQRIGAESVISGDPVEINKARKIILPGVGAFDAGMQAIEDSGLRPLLRELVVRQKKPTLGVCLGMQLLTRGSQEGRLPGLGWVGADAVAFSFDSMTPRPKIPHMGWNSTTQTQADPLFEGLDEARFYFVHSYYVKCDSDENIIARTDYGFEFVSAFRYGNIWGTQFHPEKSHRFGMRLLKNFAEFN